MAKRVNLLEDNITSALTKLAIPLMGMSFLQMAYNLTDMFWIGKLGAGPVASVGTGGQLIWLSTGIHMLAQLGGQVLVAQNLGAGNTKKAGTYAHSALFLSAVISIILGLIFIFASSPLIGFFKLNDPQVVLDAKAYLISTGGCIFFLLAGKLLTSLITTTGDSRTPFLATTVGLVFNMVLDPVLIFGLFGLPELGVLGAGIATVFAQAIVFFLLLLHTKKDTQLFCFVSFREKPDFSACKRILKLSFPTALQNTLFPLISIYISRMVAGFGDNAVAVQRIGSQVESISWMTTEGFAIAVNSFIAQNYGAGNLERAKKGFYQSLAILSIFGCFSTILLIYFAEPIFSIFLSEPDVLIMGKEYLVILGFSQLFMCLEILSGSSMNALGKTVVPATISIFLTSMRIPTALFLSATALGLCGIWWSITLTSILKGLFLLACILIFLKSLYQAPKV